MAPLRLVAALAIAATACVQQPYSDPSTFPEPMVVSGPPGGAMDPEWQARSSGDYADATVVEPSADPEDPGYAMGAVTDAEIDATLESYGEWIETDDYGLVWRPYATDVGADFTPYESGGSWIWTDWGWTFNSDWDWGWLPFHYGEWGWFDDYWAWVPDDQWSPAQVEWRGGGGYVGWRPKAPRLRDHRTGPKPYGRDHRGTVATRDHRRASPRDSHWRFAAETDFGKPHIRAHLFKSPAEGLRLTSVQTRPALRGNVQAIRAASLMRNRFANGRVRAQIESARPTQAGPTRRPSTDRGRPWAYDRNPARARAFDRAFRDSQPSVYQPGYDRPSNANAPLSPTPPTAPSPTWHERGGDRTQSTFTPTQQPTTPPPTWRGRNQQPQGTFTPSATPVWGRPSAPASSSTWSPSAPSSPNAPSHSWSPSSSSAPSHSWSPSSSSSSSHDARGSSAPSSSASPASGGGSRSHHR